MPKRVDHVTELPGDLAPLLTLRQLETYYGVSNWTVYKWIRAGMPTVPMFAEGRKRQRRFDLSAVQRWHAEHSAARTARGE